MRVWPPLMTQLTGDERERKCRVLCMYTSMINNYQLVLELAPLAHFPQRTGESRIAECGPLLHARSMKIISLISSIHGRYAVISRLEQWLQYLAPAICDSPSIRIRISYVFHSAVAHLCADQQSRANDICILEASSRPRKFPRNQDQNQVGFF